MIRFSIVFFLLIGLFINSYSQITVPSGGNNGNSSGSSGIASSAVVYWNGKETVKILFGSKQVFLEPSGSKVISITPGEGYNLKLVNGASKEFTYDKWIIFERGKNHIYVSMDSYGNISVIQETDTDKKARIKHEEEQARQRKEEQQRKEEYQSYFKKGNKAYTDGNYELALEMYAKAKKLIQTSDVENNYKLALKKVNYNKAIKSGQNLMSQRKFESARNKFEEAKSLSETQEVKDFIQIVNYYIEFDQKYEEAKRLYNTGKYAEAKKLYEVDLKSISIVLKGEKAKEIETNIALCEAKLNQKAKSERITDLHLSIDEAIESKDFELALNLLDELYKLKPESSVSMKKTEVNKLYGEHKELMKKSEYNMLIVTAESAFKSEDYGSAAIDFELAYELYPTEKIKKKLEETKVLYKEQTKRRYDESIRVAKKYMSEENFRKALKEYEKAYSLIESEDVLSIINNLKEKVQNLQALQNKYDKLVQEAIYVKYEEDYSTARVKLKEAMKLMEEDPRAERELNDLATYKLLNTAQFAYKSGDLKSAISDLKSAVKKDKSFDEAYVLLAKCYEKEGNTKRAFKGYNEALENNPKNIDAHFQRAKLYYQEGEYNEAIIDLNAAIELAPLNFDIRRCRVLSYLKTENYDQALKDCNFIIRETKDNSLLENCWYDVSIIHYYNQNYDESIYAIDKAIKLNSKVPVYYYQKGIALIEKGEVFKADENFEMTKNLVKRGDEMRSEKGLSGVITLSKYTFFETKDESDLISDSLARDYFEVKLRAYLNAKASEFFIAGKKKLKKVALDSAKTNFTYALTLLDSFDNAYYYRGLTNYQLKLNREAESDYTKAIELNKSHHLAFMDRGKLYFSEEKYQKSYDDFTSNSELQPANAEAYYLSGRSYFRLKRYTEANVSYQKAIDLEKSASFVYDTLYREKGWGHYVLKEYDEAIKMFSECIKLNDKYPLCYYNKGLTYYDMESYKDAVGEFSNAVKYDAGYEEAYVMRAHSHFKLEDWTLSKSDYERTKELNSMNKDAFIGIKETSNKLQLYNEGLQAWETYLQLEPKMLNDSTYNVDLFELCLNAKELNKGIEALENASKWINSKDEVNFKRACLYAYSGKSKEAIENMRLIDKSKLKKPYKNRAKKSNYFKPIKKNSDFKAFLKEK